MGYDGQVIGYLIIKKPYKVLSNYHKVNDLVFNSLGLLLPFLVFVFFSILYRWIRRPLKIISESLSNNDTTKLKTIEKGKNEFSQIARLISIFHHQKQELERENIEINEMQKRLIQQKSVLQGMALASNHLLTNEDFENAIRDALEIISSKADIDRIFIYKNSQDPVTGARKAVRVQEYIPEEIKKNIDTGEVNEIQYSNRVDGWFHALMNGETIKGLSHEFRDDIKLIFDPQKIHSLILNMI